MRNKEQNGAGCKTSPREIDNLSIPAMMAMIHNHRRLSAEIRKVEQRLKTLLKSRNYSSDKHEVLFTVSASVSWRKEFEKRHGKSVADAIVASAPKSQRMTIKELRP